MHTHTHTHAHTHTHTHARTHTHRVYLVIWVLEHVCMSREVIRASFWCVDGKVKFLQHRVFPRKPCDSIVHPSIFIIPPVICSARKICYLCAIFFCLTWIYYNNNINILKLQVSMIVCTVYLWWQCFHVLSTGRHLPLASQEGHCKLWDHPSQLHSECLLLHWE